MPMLMRAAGLALLVAVAPPALAEAPTPTLSLSAEGIVRAVPDTAIVSAGVVTQAETAGPALDQNNASMAALIEELKRAGIPETDIATSDFAIDPVTVYPEARSDGTQDPPRIVGYRVTNQVTVEIAGIDKAGALLDKVVRIGANRINGISFVVDDDAALRDAARRDAMRKVREKAALYAEAGGFTLGRLLAVSESVAPMPYAAAPMAARAMDTESVPKSVPMAAGEREIAVTVNVSWEIVGAP